MDTSVKMGEFLNGFVVDPQSLITIAAFVVLFWAFFGWRYDRFVGEREKAGDLEGYTAIIVVAGVSATLIGIAVISWKSAVLALVGFSVSGVFMIVGDVRRYMIKRATPAPTPRRKPLPYAANGLIDDALMAASDARRTLGKVIEKSDLEPVEIIRKVAEANSQLVEIVLSLNEVKGIGK